MEPKKQKQTNEDSPQETLMSRLFPSRGMQTDKENLMENLSMMLDAGINVVTAVHSVKQELKSKTMIDALEKIEDDVSSGSYLWKSFQKAAIMPRYVISLLQVGEESGRLPENLQLIAIQQAKENLFKSKVGSALLYPSLIFSVTFLVGIGVSWFTLPRLAQVFSSLKQELPLITEIMISVGVFLGEYGLYVIPALLILVVLLIAAFFRVTFLKRIGIWFMFKIPGVKDLIQEIELSRMGYILGTLLNAGLPITKSITSLADAATFERFRNFFLHLEMQVEKGTSFEVSFAEYKNAHHIIPRSVQQMIFASEQSGKLAETFIKVGERYEAKIDVTTKNLVVILEPLMLVVVWGFIVIVAFSVILPIYSLIGGLSDV